MALATEKCEDQLVKCEIIMDMSQSIVRHQQDELNSQLQTILRLDKENDILMRDTLRLAEQQNKWYRNPFIMGILGVSVGVLAIEMAR